MTLQMHVLTLIETGHILAAIASTNSGVDPDVASLVGTDLPVLVPRDKADVDAPVAIPVPAELLEVKSLVYDPLVIAHPLAHVVDGGRVTSLPAAAPATPSDISPGLIKVKTAVAEIPVVVVVYGKDDPDVRRAASGMVPTAPPKEVDLTLMALPGNVPASIPAGKNYYLLIAEGGSRLRLETDVA